MHDNDKVSNPSNAPRFEEICHMRRRLLGGASVGAALALTGLPLAGCSSVPTTAAKPASPTFRSIAVSTADAVIVPEGYDAYVLYAWGDPVSNGPAFKHDATNTAAEQEAQAGLDHDALHFFPMVTSAGNALSSEHGLLVMNHEYTDDGLLHPDGMRTWSAAKVAKSQAAHGVSVIEVRKVGDRWAVVRP